MKKYQAQDKWQKENMDTVTISETDCIKAIQLAAEKLGKTPTKEWYEKSRSKPTFTAIMKIFGSWNNALLAAGLSINKISHKDFIYNKESCINSLQMVAKQIGRTPTILEYGRMGLRPSNQFIINAFGTWRNAIAAAGLEAAKDHRATKYSQDDCINALQLATRKIGKQPVIREYVELDLKPSYAVIIKIFGSWRNGLRASGFEIVRNQRRYRYSREDCISAILFATQKLGKTPTATEYRKLGLKPSYSCIARMFGNWRSVLEATGFAEIQNEGQNADREYHLEELEGLTNIRLKRGWTIQEGIDALE